MKTIILSIIAIISGWFGASTVATTTVEIIATTTPQVVQITTQNNEEVKKEIKQIATVYEAIIPVETKIIEVATTTIPEIIEATNTPEIIIQVAIQEEIKQPEQVVEPIQDKSQILLRDCNTKRKFVDVLYMQENGETQICFLVLDKDGKATHTPKAIVSDETGKEFKVWSNSKGKVYDDNGNKFNGETFTPFYLSVLDYNATSSHTINIKTDNGLTISQNILVE